MKSVTKAEAQKLVLAWRKKWPELDAYFKAAGDMEPEAIRITIDSPYATTRSLVSAALRDVGFRVTVDGLEDHRGGYLVASKTARNLQHTRTPVIINTTTDARMDAAWKKKG